MKRLFFILALLVSTVMFSQQQDTLRMQVPRALIQEAEVSPYTFILDERHNLIAEVHDDYLGPALDRIMDSGKYSNRFYLEKKVGDAVICMGVELIPRKKDDKSGTDRIILPKI